MTIAGIERFFADLPSDVRAVVIHGEGEHFCAGLDLNTVEETDATEGIWHSRAWHRTFERIESGSVPVFAALQGAVVGGGLELACACHVRVADRTAFYALPEGQRGIFVGGGASVRLPRLIEVARMMDMMLTGRTYGGEEGVALGFSQYLTEPGQALTRAIELAERAAANTRLTNFAVDTGAAAYRRSRSAYRQPHGKPDGGHRHSRQGCQRPAPRLPRGPRAEGDAAKMSSVRPVNIAQPRAEFEAGVRMAACW